MSQSATLIINNKRKIVIKGWINRFKVNYKFDDFSLRLLGCKNKPHMHKEIMLPNGDKKDISGVDSNYGYETKTMKNELMKWIEKNEPV